MPAPYPEEFRREAVRLLQSSGKSVAQLAFELGISPRFVADWAGPFETDGGAKGRLRASARSGAAFAVRSRSWPRNARS
jgi:transposase-like protein